MAPRRRLDHEQIKELAEVIQPGQTRIERYKEIAEQIGCSYQAIAYICDTSDRLDCKLGNRNVIRSVRVSTLKLWRKNRIQRARTLSETLRGHKEMISLIDAEIERRKGHSVSGISVGSESRQSRLGQT